MKRRYVLKNRRRFAAVVMIFSLVTVFTGLMVNAGAASQQQEAYEAIRVAKGDTLWEIALDHAKNTDPRSYIHKVKKLNQINGDHIFAGQVLLLP